MDTICWDCAKCSDSKQCSWANGVPRTDWEVVPTYINNQGRPPIQSYIVVKCDGFVPGAERLTVSDLSKLRPRV